MKFEKLILIMEVGGHNNDRDSDIGDDSPMVCIIILYKIIQTHVSMLTIFNNQLAYKNFYIFDGNQYV